MTPKTKHLMFVLSNAVPGREDEYNRWYNERHLADILGLDGFHAAQRYGFEGEQPPRGYTPPYRYLATYEVAEGELATARNSLDRLREESAEAMAAGRPPRISPSSSMADPWGVFWMTALTPRIIKG